MKIYKISNVKSDGFKEWFGDWEDPKAFTSKRKGPSSFGVDDNLQPKTFYHGTTKDFNEFEVGQKGTNSNILGNWETTRHAIFFTPDPNHANAFTSQGGETTGGNIIPVYLNVQAPLDFRNGVNDDILDEFSTVGINPRWLQNFHWGHLDDDEGKIFVEAAKSLGYDGVIFNDQNPDTRDGQETWAVFNPNQIKSAIGNVGMYDKNSNNIVSNTKLKIFKISKYDYHPISNQEDLDDDLEDNSSQYEEADKVFQNAKIRYDSTKDISDIVSNNGTVIGATASGWDTTGDKCVFSFDIAIQERYRGQKIGTELVDRTIRKFESERQEYAEIYGKDTMMRLEAVNVNFGEYLIRNYGFTLERKLPDRIILVRV
jgi:GNAT superfamily N-acetyltransferase